EMVPVGPLVAAIDQVAGHQDEIELRVPTPGIAQESSPTLEPRLGVAQVEETDGATAVRGRLHGLPGAPPPGCPIAECIIVDPVRLQSAHLDPVAVDDWIIQHAGCLQAGRVAL